MKKKTAISIFLLLIFLASVAASAIMLALRT
jgi:hypothetical protein